MDYRELPDDSVLHLEDDEQLIKGLEKYARVAGIQGNMEYIWQSVKNNKNISRQDRNMVKKLMPFKSKMGKNGAMYIGHPVADLTKKFMALTGLFVRNYIHARYTNINSLMKDIEDNYEFNCTVMFIPNFHPKIKANDSKHHPLPSWKRGQVLSFLIECQSKNIDLVIGVYNIKAAEEHFGQEVLGYLKSNFLQVEISANE